MDKITDSDLRKAHELLTRTSRKPEIVIMDGVTFGLVKGDWVRGRWIDEHYEAVE